MNAARYRGKHVVASILFLCGALSAHAFTIRRPPPANDAVAPSASPPFRHWDLREFPDSIVPFSFRDGTPDIPGSAEFDEATAAFVTWEAALPAVIGFARVLPGAAALCPYQIDAHNLIGWNALGCPGPGDDVCLAGGGCTCGAAVAPGAGIVGPGPDGIVSTSPNQCRSGGDDVVDAGGSIVDGGNGSIDTVPNALPSGTLGQTFVFYQPGGDGRILEADIVFNDISFAWVMTPNQAATPTLTEVRTVALHEIGHFFGLGHVPAGPDADNSPFGNFPGAEDVDADGDGVLDTPIMDSPTQTALHTLSDDDRDGINFLYTPDLGDAPDPFDGFPNYYPSRVHGTTHGRMLNDLQLFVPAEGAGHLFGFYGGAAAPRYQYEWLGSAGRIDDHALEGEARVPDLDAFDDGVTFGGPFVAGGPPVAVTVNVQTAADIAGGTHAYGAAQPMFINAWFDWNADGDWDDAGEHAIGGAPGGAAVLGAGGYVFMIAAPLGAAHGGLARFRLDYREDVGQVAAPHPSDPTLALPRGPAQFGEVEDYRTCIVERIVVVNSNADEHDGLPGDGVCDTGNATVGFTGICTLRAALTETDQTSGADAIHFSIPGAGVPTIRPLGATRGILGTLHPICMDGTTQMAGRVELDGSLAGMHDPADRDMIGLELLGQRSVVRGMVINRFAFDGILIRPTGAPFGGDNIVENNFIGTDITGTMALGNGRHGVQIISMPNNVIGGMAPAARNVISGNVENGVHIRFFGSGDATDNKVLGNFIGTDVTGTQALGNGGDGVVILTGASGNLIGHNAIAHNGGLGIDLGDNGVTANDEGDFDSGPNNLQNFPVLTSAISIGGSTTIQGTLNSTANTTFTLEFFSNTTCDLSGFGEGATFIGSRQVTTVGNSASFMVTFPGMEGTGGDVNRDGYADVIVGAHFYGNGQSVTVTATDPDGNTSEFSRCESVQVDADGDGFTVGAGDCDDSNPAVHPGAAEVCDNLDNNCNGSVDEDLGQTTCGVGACQTTMDNCVNGQPQTCTPGEPGAEICNGVDDDCNASVDDGLGQTTCGVGACEATVDNCVNGQPQTCTPGEPAPETCNGVDDDCNNLVDDVPPPGGSPSLTVQQSGSDTILEWTPMGDATAYDVVRGDVGVLRSMGGDFTSATEACPANDHVATTLPVTASPASGEASWFLVRGVTCGGSGTYDSGAASQVGSRDAEINASAMSCP